MEFPDKHLTILLVLLKETSFPVKFIVTYIRIHVTVI